MTPPLPSTSAGSPGRAASEDASPAATPPPDLDAIARSPDAAALDAAVRGALRASGFAGFEYYWFTRRGGAGRIYPIGAPPGGRDAALLCADPFVQHCRHAYTPVVWQSMAPDASLRQVLLWSPWKQVPATGQGGVAVPLQGPGDSFALLSAALAGRRESAGPAAECIHWIHAAALTVHDRVVTNCDNRLFGLKFTGVDGYRIAALLGESCYRDCAMPLVRH